MDVRLPDGTIIKGVPDDMSKADLTAKLQSNGYDVTKLMSPSEQIPTRSFGEAVSEAVSNAPVSGYKALKGFVSNVLSPIETAKSIRDLTLGGSLNLMPNEARDAALSMYGADEKQARESMRIAKEMGGQYAKDYGSWEGFKNKLATDPIGTAMDLSTILSLGGGVATKAGLPKTASALGTAATYTDITSPFITVGGKAISGSANIVGGVYNNLLDPKSAAYLRAVEGKGPEIVNALRNPEILPGSMPTAGIAAAPVGSTRFAALQADLAPFAASDYYAREQARKAALTAPLTVDPTAINMAEAIRNENAARAYGPIMGERVNPMSDLAIAQENIAKVRSSKESALRDWGKFETEAAQQQTLAQGGVVRPEHGGTGQVSPSAYPVEGYPRVSPRYTENFERIPEYRAAAGEAADIAKQRQTQQSYLENSLKSLQDTVGVDNRALSDLTSRPSMQAAVRDALKSAQETGKYFPAAPGEQFSVANLQRIKESLDAGIKEAVGQSKTPGAPKPQLSVEELTNTRNQFVDWLSNKVPEWKTAREAYAAESKPISQMEVAGYLKDRLTGALGEEKGKLRADAFATAVKEAPATLKKSTGSNRFEHLSEVLTPDQLRTVNQIQDELVRGAKFDELAAAGKAAGKQSEIMTSALRESAGITKAPSLLSRVATIANVIIERLEGKVNKKLATEMALEMLDPNATAASIERALIRNERGAARGAVAAQVGNALNEALRSPARKQISNYLSNLENVNELSR